MPHSQSRPGWWRAPDFCLPSGSPQYHLEWRMLPSSGDTEAQEGVPPRLTVPWGAPRPGPEMGAPACTTACGLACPVSSVLLAHARQTVGRRLVLFNLKGVVAFPVEQRETGQGPREAPDVSQRDRTFQPPSPEAAGAVEVPVAARAAQGGVLIADAAPRELFILRLGPGGRGLGLPGPERNGGEK